MQAWTFNRRHAQWRIFLSDFNFEIHYQPGKQLGKPDALSRRANYIDIPMEPEVMIPAEIFANTSEEELEIVTEICSKIKEDPSLEPIIQFLTEDANNAPPSICKAKLVVPDSEPLKEQLLREFHDSPLVGHPGQQQTLELLSRNYWWPGMKSSAKEWVECCPTCEANQHPHAPVIALKPLEVPPFPFHTISYDFITGFPKSHGHDAILVIIDSFSKFGHFIPTSKKVTAKGLVDLFITHIWKCPGHSHMTSPFEITEKISSHVYHLKLLETLKIHDVFYIGLLSKSHKSPSQPFPEQPPPETIEGEEEYEVEQIIDSKKQCRKWFYIIKWKGYGPEDNSWEPEELLEHSHKEIQCFNKSQLKKACDSAKSLSGGGAMLHSLNIYH
ncbi:Retrotransposable element Tf2 protein [Rhizoctonia solani]|uniref:Retrotransposable element Tf2 protein n=1 Tax=Rhizoctonia solani TaxID=456999 RepID=A0A8H8P0J1_9AGAM|nr:Retrotransposable element Tf2 protein [Rhizoctonia solani]QRW22117.1 Retrotransposable element Tf2 protein [Rhizoctonia solani]